MGEIVNARKFQRTQELQWLVERIPTVPHAQTRALMNPV